MYLQKHENTSITTDHLLLFFLGPSFCTLLLCSRSLLFDPLGPQQLWGIFIHKFLGSSHPLSWALNCWGTYPHQQATSRKQTAAMWRSSCVLFGTLKKRKSRSKKKQKPKKTLRKSLQKFSPLFLTYVCFFFWCLNFMPVRKQNAGWGNWFWRTWQPSFGTPWLPWRCLRNPTSYNLRQNVSGWEAKRLKMQSCSILDGRIEKRLMFIPSKKERHLQHE